MEEIKGLLSKALKLSKEETENTSMILDLWEDTLAELKTFKFLLLPVPATQKSGEIEKKNEETVLITCPLSTKRKRGRPKKTESEKAVNERTFNIEKVVEVVKGNDNIETSSARRQSQRKITPSKRYADYSVTAIKEKEGESITLIDKNIYDNGLTENENLSQDDINATKSKTVQLGDLNDASEAEFKKRKSEEKSEEKASLKVKDEGEAYEEDEDIADDNTDDDSLETSNKCQEAHEKVKFSFRKSRPKKHKIQHDRHQCHTCGKVMASISNLIVHMRSHNGEKPYKCRQCGREFSSRSNMKRHELTHSGAKPYECSQCHKCFTEKKSMQVHMRQHTGDRPYKCEHCDQSFAQAGTLKMHLNIHNGVKAYLCDYCGKPFRQKSQMKIHVLRHNNIRNYKCDVCSDTFISKGDMERHRMKHSGERPYRCNVCPKAFKRMQYLKEHLNKHKKSGKPTSDIKSDVSVAAHTCKVCGGRIKSLQMFLEHVKSHEIEKDRATSSIQGELVSLLPGVEEAAEEGSQDMEAQETVILVLDQSVIDGMYSSPDSVAHLPESAEAMEKVLIHNEADLVEENVISESQQDAENQVHVVSEDALRFLQESQGQYQTLIVTEEQLAHLQHLSLGAGDIITTEVSDEGVTLHAVQPDETHTQAAQVLQTDTTENITADGNKS